jgi:hypothetical protein
VPLKPYPSAVQGIATAPVPSSELLEERASNPESVTRQKSAKQMSHFSLKSFKGLRLMGHLGKKELHGHMPVQPSVFGLVHLAHATTTDSFGMRSRVNFVPP